MELEDLFKEVTGDWPEDRVNQKYCRRCASWKPVTEFNKRSEAKDTKSSECRACASLRFSRWREKNYATVLANDRAKHYARKYGLDKELSAILAHPEARTMPCPICRQTMPLVLDHDHATGKARGLICPACNKLLGCAKDSLDILYEAIAYLKRHKGI